MKRLTLYTAFLFVTTIFAQYQVDWAVAPENPVPLKYTTQHYNFKGAVNSVFDEEDDFLLGDQYKFNKDGFLLSYEGSIYVGKTTYTYDANNKLLSYYEGSVYSSTTNVPVFDSKGRITRIYKDKEGSEKYDTFKYNAKGLLVEEKDRYGKTHLYTYDSKGRIIKKVTKEDRKRDDVLTYSYSKEGNKTKVYYQYQYAHMSEPGSETRYYDIHGNRLYRGASANKYDSQGNVIEYVNYSDPVVFTYYVQDNTTATTNKTATPLSTRPKNTNTTTAQNTSNTTLGCEYGDCQNGWGKKNFNHGYYVGFWENGMRQGYGMFNWNTSGKYIGFWEQDKMDGYGCYLGTGKDLVGEYVNGSLHGKGYTREVETNKFVYGIWKNYLIDTEYTFYKTNNSTGCVAGDCQNKYGRYKWSNGDAFVGFFKNGNMELGTYTFANGDKYEGFFNNQNQFHGQGRFFFKDGGYYGGEWHQGSYHGQGYYHDKNYKQQKGIWSNGTLTQPMN